MSPAARRRSTGFTLVEVLVALSMVAVALMAGFKASQAAVTGVERQSQLLLAQLCVENELARLRLAAQLPGVGISEAACEQGGRAFVLRTQAMPTPNRQFRRVTAQALDGDAHVVLGVTTVVGR